MTGSESTGKTILAADLAAHYRTVWVPEHGREYVDAKNTPLDYTDIEAIARGQVAAEEEAAPRANRVLIQDTDLISTVVYSHHYYGKCPEWVERAAVERRAHLYLLHHPDVPWVPDALQRDRPHMREAVHALFRRTLQATGCRYVDVQGPWGERKRQALQAIDALMAEVVTPR